MKKAKLMLTGIAILSVVGAALAFKAKSAFTASYCTSTTSGTCPTFSSSKKTGTSGTVIYYVTTLGGSCGTPNCSGDQVNNVTTSTTFALVADK